MFFRGSEIESTTLPIPLLLEKCQLPILIVSIRFELQIPKLPISGDHRLVLDLFMLRFKNGVGFGRRSDRLGGQQVWHRCGGSLFDYVGARVRLGVRVHWRVGRATKRRRLASGRLGLGGGKGSCLRHQLFADQRGVCGAAL